MLFSLHNFLLDHLMVIVLWSLGNFIVTILWAPSVEKSEGVDQRATMAKDKAYEELNFVRENTTKSLGVLGDSTSNADATLFMVESVVNEIAKEVDDILR